MHGSATKKARAAAARRVQMRQATQIATRMGVPIDVDPHVALLAAVHESAGVVAFYRSLIDELAPAVGGALVDVIDDEGDSGGIAPRREWREGIAGPDHLGDARMHVFVQAYNEERDRLVRHCRTAIAAGVEERQVRVAEQQAQMIAIAIRGLLRELGIDIHEGSVRQLVSKHLMLISSAETAPTDDGTTDDD